jgi:hypothetical protein
MTARIAVVNIVSKEMGTGELGLDSNKGKSMSF